MTEHTPQKQKSAEGESSRKTRESDSGPDGLTTLSLPPAMLDDGPMPVVSVDRKLAVIRANRSFLRYADVSEDAIFGKKITEVIPTIASHPLHEVLRRKEILELRNCRIVMAHAPERQEKYWDLVISPVGPPGGTAEGLLIVGWDVSERHRLMQQREDFLAILANSISPSLLADHRALEVLMGGVLGKDSHRQSEMLSLIHKNNVGQMKMIHDLVEVFRYETGIKELEFKSCDLAALLDSCVAEISPIAQRIQVRVQATVPRILHRIDADAMSLHRLFINLLSNAVKFSPINSTIEVQAMNLNDAVVVRVKDEGKGVPPQDEAKLFQRFCQTGADPQLQGRYPVRIGVGLYLCARIVEAHHGDLRYARGTNGGSVFSVVLPQEHPEPTITTIITTPGA